MTSQKLRGVAPLMRQKLTAIVTDAAAQARDIAISVAPYGDGTDGGHLRDRITAQAPERPSPGAARFAATVTCDSPHAAYVEFGTLYAPAQPFMTPAFYMAAAASRQAAKF